jgi:hypothetical protein
MTTDEILNEQAEKTEKKVRIYKVVPRSAWDAFLAAPSWDEFYRDLGERAPVGEKRMQETDHAGTDS